MLAHWETELTGTSLNGALQKQNVVFTYFKYGKIHKHIREEHYRAFICTACIYTNLK